jgi:hypothetical protein
VFGNGAKVRSLCKIFVARNGSGPDLRVALGGRRGGRSQRAVTGWYATARNPTLTQINTISNVNNLLYHPARGNPFPLRGGSGRVSQFHTVIRAALLQCSSSSAASIPR